MPPFLQSLELTIERPTHLDKLADRERLVQAIQRELGKELPVAIDLRLLRRLPRLLREKDFSLIITLCILPERIEVISLDKASPYGIAIDIGTTNIVASLLDLQKGERLSRVERENPQIEAGMDVLTRVQRAMTGEEKKLQILLVEGVNRLIADVCAVSGVTPSEVSVLSIAGNTIMSHFLLGLPVENIPLAPYIPTSHGFGFLSPHEPGLSMNPFGLIFLFPNAGSYVGGDIISGILAAGIHREEAPVLLIDVGTNAEIVLGCRDWIMVGAGAAGPALEGGISGIGMRALPGAVDSAELKDGKILLSVLGGAEPEGICGSGMISLVFCLYEAGIIDAQGRLSGSSPVVRTCEGERAVLLHETAQGSLVLKEKEIENFLRSKAAMFASLVVTVSSVGLGFRDIKKVFISGALGTGIDLEKAIGLGMLPDLPRERFIPLGNSSLAGAEMLLFNSNLLFDLESVTDLVTYREMNTDGDFMREFPAALFIPHTNPERLRS